jgi:membrane fusion protein (multidrug efflux system)
MNGVDWLKLCCSFRVSRLVLVMKVAFLLSFGTACEKNQGLRAREIAPLTERVRYVEAVQPASEDFYEETPFIGVLIPGKVVSLHFPVAGRLGGCSVKDGQKVQRGQTLCWLDTSMVDLEIERTQDAIFAAEKILSSDLLSRQKELYDAGVVGQAEYEQFRIQNETASAELRQAQSLLKLAEQKKSEHQLRAPWDGRVSDVKLSPGQLISPELTVGFINSDSGLRVELHLHASLYGHVVAGTNIEVTSLAGRPLVRPLSGVIAEVASTVDPSTQMFRLLAQLSFNDDAEIVVAAGMVLRGTIRRRVAEQTLVLPASSLLRWTSGGGAEVFVVRSGRLSRQSIEVEAYSQDRVAVRSGVTSSDQVVRRFASDLYDGLPVRSFAPNTASESERHPNEGGEE